MRKIKWASKPKSDPWTVRQDLSSDILHRRIWTIIYWEHFVSTILVCYTIYKNLTECYRWLKLSTVINYEMYVYISKLWGNQ
jgi:hypothetical protein